MNKNKIERSLVDDDDIQNIGKHIPVVNKYIQLTYNVLFHIQVSRIQYKYFYA